MTESATFTCADGFPSHPFAMFEAIGTPCHPRSKEEPNGVKALLKQAYANAEKENGVVYDLSWYGDEIGVDHPFVSYD